MALAHAQRDGFEQRLARIKNGGANTMGEVHIGPPDEESARKGKGGNRVRVKSRRKKDVKLNGGSTAVLLPIGVFIGGLSMFSGQAAAYHLFAEGGLLNIPIPVEALQAAVPYMHFVIGGILALMFSWTFGLSSMIRRLAVIGGFAAVLYFQADLIQKFPGIYANFFSVEFVEKALSAA